MLTKNRITLLFLAFLFILIAVVIAARHGSGQTSGPANGTRMKVLRRKDQLHIKPSAAEIASNQFQEGSPATQKEERELDDQIPKHLPIRIKIKKEKEEAFKDLKNEKWLRELELEVKNVGDKPIYFLSLLFSMPEIKAPDGNEYGFSLHYGRGDLLDFLTPLRPEDIPLNPGETYVFRIRDNMIKGWENYSGAENKANPRPKKVLIRFNLLNFGDKTGFMGTSGIRIPNTPQPKGDAVRCVPDSNKSDPKWRLIAWSYPFGSQSAPATPARDLPAIFFSAASSELVTTESNSMPDICCPGTSCNRLKSTPGRCYCSDPELPEVNDKSNYTSASCDDSSAACGHNLFANV